MLRYLIAAVAATALFAPSAHAATRFVFATERGAPAQVSVDSSSGHTRMELTRGGTVVGSTATDELDITGLMEGDVATLYAGQAPIASATYKALPAINDTACIGRTAFNVQRDPAAVMLDAGAYEIDDRIASVWSAGASSTVTLERPLRAGDVAYALTSEIVGNIEILSHRAVPVFDCPVPVKPDLGPLPPPPSLPTPGGPTDQQLGAALKGATGATGSSLRSFRLPRLAKRASVALPFAFPEPGTVTLELAAKGKAIGSGTKRSTANGKLDVAVKLTAAGRKLLKRAKKSLKVTVKAGFVATRPGTSAQSTSVTVTLRR
jgi:hypothetical protein